MTTDDERGAQIAELQTTIRALWARIDRLEAHAFARAPVNRPPAEPPLAGRTLVAPVAEVRGPSRAWWQVGPLAGVPEDRLPSLVLASAGGLALTFGLMFFAWYAVDQGWLKPALRVSLGGAVGAALIVFAWRIAPRQSAVAGALGGAGLGAYFGAWLVARHVHGLVDNGIAFAGLALGAAACLLVAGHRRLRIMAVLATVAAYVTPVATASGADRLHELMAYELAVMGALWALELRHRWHELPLLGLVGTWALMLGWAAEHLRPDNAAAPIAWGALVLALGSYQALAAIRQASTLHVVIRYATSGVLGWILLSWAASHDELWLQAVTLGLAGFNMAGFWALRRRGATLWGLAVPAALAWLQLFAFGPMAWTGNGLGIYWSVMASVAAAIFAWRPGWTGMRMWVAPGLGAIGWSIVHVNATGVPYLFGLWSAAALLSMGLYPRVRGADSPVPEEEGGLQSAVAFGGAGVAWLTVASEYLGAHEASAWLAITVLPVALAIALRPVLRASLHHYTAGLTALAIAVAVTIVTAADLGHFVAIASDGRVPSITAAAIIAVVASGSVVSLRGRTEIPERGRLATLHDLSGLVAATGFAVACILGVTAVVASTMVPGPGADSSNMAGSSVAIAATALALITLGLRLARARWRQLGLAALAVVAAKVVFVDLAQVDLAWRVVSFVGLGICMVAGAWLYGRRETPSVPPPPAA